MKLKEERGAVILESTYCILISILVLMFLISFGFYLYQNTIVTVTANRIAGEVSQTYKLREVSDSSYVGASDISGIGKYRYLFFADAFNMKNEAKAKNLANVRLSRASLAEEEGDLSVDVETVVDDIGRRHYEITVRQKYTFLLGELLSVFNQSDLQTLSETVYVESSDVSNYVNTVKTTKYGVRAITERSDVLQLGDDVLSLIKSSLDLVKSLFDN